MCVEVAAFNDVSFCLFVFFGVVLQQQQKHDKREENQPLGIFFFFQFACLVGDAIVHVEVFLELREEIF